MAQMYLLHYEYHWQLNNSGHYRLGKLNQVLSKANEDASSVTPAQFRRHYSRTWGHQGKSKEAFRYQLNLWRGISPQAVMWFTDSKRKGITHKAGGVVVFHRLRIPEGFQNGICLKKLTLQLPLKATQTEQHMDMNTVHVVKASYILLLPDSHFTQLVAVRPSSEGGHQPSPHCSLFHPVKIVLCARLIHTQGDWTGLHGYCKSLQMENKNSPLGLMKLGTDFKCLRGKKLIKDFSLSLAIWQHIRFPHWIWNRWSAHFPSVTHSCHCNISDLNAPTSMSQRHSGNWVTPNAKIIFKLPNSAKIARHL